YGLQAAGLGGGDMPPHERVEDMAAHALAALRQVQAEGPYQLGGWSLGGVIAFEMACMLEAQGEEVSTLLLIDSVCGDALPKSQGNLDDTDLLAALLHDMGGLAGKDLHLGREELAVLPPERRLARVVELLREADALPAWVEMDQIERFWRVFYTNFKALRRYVPKTYSGALTLFPAAESLKRLRGQVGEDLGWRSLAAGGVQVHPISGDHYSVVRQPAVHLLAKGFHAALESNEKVPVEEV
ncbi:MAG TPA: thioesterase domain-containing protein, partial [Thermoanaerobaculia bacterium]|nr:thioesterase domain-containing protein [Thermoanaerobaculia bacterium]